MGRKPAGPWPNMTPPIRGGVYRRLDATDATDATDGDPVRTTETLLEDPSNDDASSENSGSLLGQSSDLRHRAPRNPGPHGGNADAAQPGAAQTSPTCPIEYTDWAVQQGVAKDHLDYPCPDNVPVQQDIIAKYRQLHQQVKDEGLYECRYSEYGKEMIRYSSLFALFLFTLRHEWYMTSAVFLGLFWVRAPCSRLLVSPSDNMNVF